MVLRSHPVVNKEEEGSPSSSKNNLLEDNDGGERMSGGEEEEEVLSLMDNTLHLPEKPKLPHPQDDSGIA